ncbi:hypothetical protein E1301_Tti011757 [Triplophysa tibetana]|uniref:G-protein coupled receptors family 1 profile domain-containing protein n=1 Tax=Triplophysa tibetana TaxID=1572043 RepID=A0A5A9PFW5_9TELE|nr:hypothetical protein E1301_Tti011757 [Triplophysa tibetana]
MMNSTVNSTTSEGLFESSDIMLRLRISVYSINVLFGLPTHSFIIWLIVTGTGSGIASDFLIFNLSVCEIGLCLNGVFAFFYSLQFSNLSGLMYFLSGLGITARPLFQCLMCVERYLAVIHPVTFLKYKPLRYRLICSAAAWIITLVSCSCCMFCIISLKYALFVEFYSVQFSVFISIQLFCCLAVLRALKQSGPGERGREREEENTMKRRAFYIISITTCLICVERYLAVIHPVTFLKYKPLRYRVMGCTAAWIVNLASCFLCMFAIDSKYAVYVWFLTTQLLFFLFVKLFCLSAVLRALKQSGPGERGRGREEENHMKKRAFYLILITTVTTVLMFGPMTITGFYYIVKGIYVDSPVVWLSAKTLNSAMNVTTFSTTNSTGLLKSLHVGIYIINLLFGFPAHSYVMRLIITGAGSGIAAEFFILTSSCLMCVERYLAVIHPVTFLKYKPLRYRLICCTVVWIFCFGSYRSKKISYERNKNMNNSAVNFSSDGDSTTESIGLVTCLEICVYLINLLFSLPTHSYVMRLIVTGAGSGIVSEFFILNLSACEIGICLNSFIFVLSMWLRSLSKFELFLIGFSNTGRPLFQCLMCVERYLAVIHPVTFLKYKPLRYRVMCCTAAWIFCLSSCFLCMFAIDSKYAVYVWFLTTQLLFFLFVKLFCLSAVLRALKQSGPGERGRGREEENHMKKRAFYLILITTVTTVLMFGPMTITGFYYIVKGIYVDSPVVWLSAKTLNSAMNVTTFSTTNSTGLLKSLHVGIYIINLLFGFPAHSYVMRLIITGAGSGIAAEFFILTSSCLMCVERYLAVIHPVTFLKYKPLRYRLICCTVVWIFCFGSYRSKKISYERNKNMNNSAVNFSSDGDSTTESIGLVTRLEICVYLINLLFSLPTHSYVMRLIVTGAGSGIVSEFFILNLSACEIGICLNSFIFVLSMWLRSLSKFEPFLIGFSNTGRPLFQSLMCVERYLAVIHPVTFLKYKPLRYRVMCCTAAWIFCLSSCFLCMFAIDLQYAVYVWFLTMQLLFFLFVKLFCLSAVLRALKQSGPGERGREEENHMKKRAFYLILITTVTTVLMFGPMTITGFYYIVKGIYVDSPVVWLSGILCFTLAGFVEPVLYLQRTGKFSCFRCKI